MTKQMTFPVFIAVALALTSTMALAKRHMQTESNVQGRNWSQIDSNKDHLISPEEMAGR